MWPSSHSRSSRTSRICTSSARPGRSCSARRSIASVALRSWRQLVMPPCKKPPSLRRPTATARAAARRPSSSSRPMKTISCVRSASHASLDPNPARSIGLQIEPSTWASSNCRSVRTSTSIAPCARFCSSWRGARGSTSTPSVSSGPRLSSTIALKFGGCGPRPASTVSTKRSSSSMASLGLWASSKPIVELIFMSMSGPPHIEPPRWPGQTSHAGGSPRSLPCSERKIPRAPSALSMARSGRATSLTNSVSPVRTAQGSSPRPVSVSANAVCSGRCPGVCSARTCNAPRTSSQPSTKGSWS